MVVNIKTDKERYFVQLLTLLGAMPPFSSLTSRERDVMGHLTMMYYSSKASSSFEKFAEAFGQDSKEALRLRLGITKFNLNNVLTSLRKKGFISYNFIYKDYMVRPDKELVFKFIKE